MACSLRAAPPTPRKRLAETRLDRARHAELHDLRSSQRGEAETQAARGDGDGTERARKLVIVEARRERALERTFAAARGREEHLSRRSVRDLDLDLDADRRASLEAGTEDDGMTP